MEPIDFSKPPVLKGDGFTLRPHRPEDAQGVYERCIDPAALAWTSIPREYTLEMAASYIEELNSGESSTWSWALEVDGSYAGTLDLRFAGTAQDWAAEEGEMADELAHRRAEAAQFGSRMPVPTASLGYVVHPAFRGRGLMGQAVRLAVDEAFRRALVERILWQAAVGNWGSFKTVQAAGFPDFLEVPALLGERGLRLDGWVSVLTRDAWAAGRGA